MNWRDLAACHGMVDRMFPLEKADEPAAKQICARCPVRNACLEWALRHRQEYGIWGGRNPIERGLIVNRRTAAARVAS